MKCIICHREIKKPESIHHLMGSVCRKKFIEQKKDNGQLKLWDKEDNTRSGKKINITIDKVE